MSGRVQLARSGIAHLLKQCPGREQPETDMAKAVKEPETFDHLPVESEDESNSALALEFRDSSDDYAPDQSIKPTKFTSDKDPPATKPIAGRGNDVKWKGTAKATGKSTQQRSIRAKKRPPMEDVDTDEDDSFRSRKKAKSGSEKIANEVGDHMKAESLLFNKPKPKGRSAGYGRKSNSRANSRNDRFQTISASASPVKFKGNDQYASLGSSPVGLKLSQKMDDEDGSSSGLSDPPPSDKSDPPRALDGRHKNEKVTRLQPKKAKKKLFGLSAEPMSQAPTFKMPDAYQDYAPAELIDRDTAMDEVPVEKRQLDPGMALCPMCDEQVDEELLKGFSKGTRMRLAQQVKFCRMHRKKSAEKTYEEKKYPKVDWTTLEARIERHHDYLKSLIMGAESHFGIALTENIRIGHARTLATTTEYPTPGYYGLRGMSVMTDVVTETFSKLLRKRAPTDTRISGRGYTGFVQSVLVPELAVKLIQEDLSLEEDKAIELMIESRAVGEILNDEKRHSHSQAHIKHRDDSDEEEVKGHEEYEEQGDEQDEDEGSVKSDDDVPTNLRTQETIGSDSDLSSLPVHSQSQASVNSQHSRKVDHSDSDDILAPIGGRESKKGTAPNKEQDVTKFPTRPSPSSRKTKTQVPVRSEIDDSEDSDSSDLSSLLDPL